MDLNMFAQAIDLSPNETMAQVQTLAQEGFLRRVGGGYGLTEKGKNALKMSAQVPQEKAFIFYADVDKPLGFSARSLEEFYRIVRQVYSDAIDFHLRRGDFEKWFGEVLDDKELADKVSRLKDSGSFGDDLRKALLKAVDTLYGVGELL